MANCPPDRGGESHNLDRVAVRRRLIELISEVAGFPGDSINDESALDADLKMQSVVFVELQVAIEEEYGIEVDPIHVVELNVFGSIVDYVRSLTVVSGQTDPRTN